MDDICLHNVRFRNLRIPNGRSPKQHVNPRWPEDPFPEMASATKSEASNTPCWLFKTSAFFGTRLATALRG